MTFRHGTSINVGSKTFENSLKTGKFSFWTPFNDAYKHGEIITLVESTVNNSSVGVEMVCLDVIHNKKGDRFYTVEFALLSGPVKIKEDAMTSREAKS